MWFKGYPRKDTVKLPNMKRFLEQIQDAQYVPRIFFDSVSKDGTSQNKRHSPRHATPRTQKQKNTLIYTQLIHFNDDEYTAKVAKSEKEICELVQLGFEYVCDYNSFKIFIKRKKPL